MKKINQIQLIEKSLKNERDKMVFDLSNLMSQLNKKKNIIDNMNAYINDYNGAALPLSKSVPSLSINFNIFINKISNAILKTEEEVNFILEAKLKIIEKISKLDAKLALMEVFNKKIKLAMNEKEKKEEQIILDDISAIKHLRN